MKKKQLKPGPYMMNRELSWLKFNERVLNEAGNPRVPLAERLTFASIYQSNLDEFYMVRVGTLMDQMESSEVVRENKTNMTSKEQVKAIIDATRELDGTNAWYAQMNTYDRHLGIMYSCVYGDEEDHSLIYAAYNMHWENHSFALPKINGTWKVDMSSNVSGAVIDDNNRSVCVEPRSVAILTGTYEIPAKKER